MLVLLLAAVLVPLVVALAWRAAFVRTPAPGTGSPGDAPVSGAPMPETLPDTSAFDAAIDALPSGRVADLERLTADADLAALAALLARGEIAAHDLAAFAAGRVRAHDPALHAVIRLDPGALVEAARLDTLLVGGGVAGPLHGVPVLVKDNIATGGALATTVGAAALVGHRPPEDAPVVARLRSAGAVILGKTNLSEWAYFMSSDAPSGHSAVGGQSVNPFGADLEVLGSSSGSAVAVAARFAPAALGTETTGSIIAPSAANGVAGMRPSTGLLDDALIAPIAAALDGAGPIARRVADLALLLEVLAGPGHDFTSELEAASLDGLRLGVPVVGGLRAADVAGTVFDEAVVALEAAGAAIVEAEVPDAAARALAHAQLPLLAGRMAADTDAWLAETRAPMPSLASIVAWNAQVPEARAPHGQDLLVRALTGALPVAEHEALVAGYRATALEAIGTLVRTHRLDALLSLDNLFSLFYAGAGVAAVTVPIGRDGGRDGGGQPHGATLVAVRPGDDAALLGIARAVERVAGRLEDPLPGGL